MISLLSSRNPWYLFSNMASVSSTRPEVFARFRTRASKVSLEPWNHSTALILKPCMLVSKVYKARNAAFDDIIKTNAGLEQPHLIHTPGKAV